MDWNLKNPSWDFADFEQESIRNIDSISGSSSFSVDLKLGQVIDSRSELGDHLKVTKMALSPSGSSKRARAVGNVVQAAMCLVDGCTADLSNCREYHRRHKVCEVHSKTPQVSINGQKQRFCQQCSRFHSLEEFDEGKRSCRKRLDGHNRRRRKPQPDTLSRAASLFSGHQGPTMLQFSGPHTYALANPPWTGGVKAEEDVRYYTNQIPFPESSSGSCKVAGKQQFNLFHDGGTTLDLHHHHHHRGSPPKACEPPLLVFRDDYEPPARVVHSDCALSLLSSSPSQTSCTTMSHVVHHPHSHLFSTTANRFEPGLSYGGLESIMVPSGSEGCTGVAHMGPDHHASARDHETPQTLPFYWE